MTIEVLRSFFGWCTVINFGVLLLSTIVLVGGKNTIAKIHANMMGMEESAVHASYFQFLAQYKIIALSLNLAPYIALRLLTSVPT